MEQQVKDPALSVQWLWSLLWCRFNFCPGNFHMPKTPAKKKKKKKKKKKERKGKKKSYLKGLIFIKLHCLNFLES